MKLGWAHGALLTTFPGDTTMATLDQVRPSPKAARRAFRDKMECLWPLRQTGCMLMARCQKT